ncbi:MAG TPA: hypothetical protein VN673_08695, partial [Clostridia bacterium]|nr:hypothetical protein [Clostridia bacterium]
MKRLFVLAALLLAVVVAPAQTPDDQYVYIYNLMQEADTLARENQATAALTRYREAYTALQSFAKGYPDWNEKVVQFRLSYLARRVNALTAESATTPAPAAAAAGSGTTAASPAAASPELQNRIAGLENQV